MSDSQKVTGSTRVEDGATVVLLAKTEKVGTSRVKVNAFLEKTNSFWEKTNPFLGKTNAFENPYPRVAPFLGLVLPTTCNHSTG